MSDNWIQIGSVGVDAGLLSLGDPCYYDNFDYDNDVLPVVLEGYKKGERHWDLPAGMIVFETTWGDGVYPVYAQYDAHGRITEVKVVMDGEDEDEDETYGDEYDEEDDESGLDEDDIEWGYGSREPGADDLLWD